MGDIVSMVNARQRRAELRRAMMERAAMHPALRWHTPEGGPAHRRRPGGSTACGAQGPLTLAGTDAEYCGVCFPYWASNAAQ